MIVINSGQLINVLLIFYFFIISNTILGKKTLPNDWLTNSKKKYWRETIAKLYWKLNLKLLPMLIVQIECQSNKTFYCQLDYIKISTSNWWLLCSPFCNSLLQLIDRQTLCEVETCLTDWLMHQFDRNQHSISAQGRKRRRNVHCFPLLSVRTFLLLIHTFQNTENLKWNGTNKQVISTRKKIQNPKPN